MKKQTISLVLGSGGARGLAHIGVIECLEQNGYIIQSISGTSMGALIGGVYAMGKLDEYTRWVTALERLDVIRLLDFSFGTNGLFKGERIIEALRELTGDSDIEDLPIKFTAVATDLDEGNEVWFDHGPLFDAIRASISIPSVVAPYCYQGRQLLDGGLVNPLPIAPTLDDNTDLTIAVHLGAKPQEKIQALARKRDDEKMRKADHLRITQFIDSLRHRMNHPADRNMSMFDIIVKSMAIMENALAQIQLATYPPDIVIEIPRNVCNFYEFHRARELIDIGYQKTRETLHQERL